MPTETFSPPVSLPTEEPRTATEMRLGIGGPPASEEYSLQDLNNSYQEERQQAAESFENSEPKSVTEELRSASESSALLAADFSAPDVPGKTPVGDFLIKTGTGINSFSAAFDAKINKGLDSVKNFAKTVREVGSDCRERILQWNGAKEAIAAHDPELGFGQVVLPEVQAVAKESLPIAAVELVQSPTPELQETPQLTTPERIKQVFDVIEGMNADGGKFDALTVTIKRFQEEYGQPEVAEAAIAKLFGGNTEIAKVVMEQGLEGVKRYQQDLDSLGIDAATTELAWKSYLEKPPVRQAQPETGQQEFLEPSEIEHVAPLELSIEQKRQKRRQEIREQLRSGEGGTTSDLPLQVQGSMLASESARLRAKLAVNPADELGSYSLQEEKVGNSTRNLEATYAGTGETVARTEAALADINLKSEVMSLMAESAKEAGNNGNQMQILMTKLQDLIGGNAAVELQRDNDTQGIPLKEFEPAKMTLGIKYQNGVLVVSLKNKAQGDASTESTLQTHSLYKER